MQENFVAKVTCPICNKEVTVKGYIRTNNFETDACGGNPTEITESKNCGCYCSDANLWYWLSDLIWNTTAFKEASERLDKRISEA